MQKDWNWTQEYYSAEARETLAAKRRDTPAEVIEQGQRDWATLIADVEAAAAQKIDPAGERAQSLASHWTNDFVAVFRLKERMWA